MVRDDITLKEEPSYLRKGIKLESFYLYSLTSVIQTLKQFRSTTLLGILIEILYEP